MHLTTGGSEKSIWIAHGAAKKTAERAICGTAIHSVSASRWLQVSTAMSYPKLW